MVSGLFEKKQDAIPPHPAPPQALPIGIIFWILLILLIAWVYIFSSELWLKIPQ
jgi:hypothetical protein